MLISRNTSQAAAAAKGMQGFEGLDAPMTPIPDLAPAGFMQIWVSF